MIPRATLIAMLTATAAAAQTLPPSPVQLPTFVSQAAPTSIPFGTTRIHWQLWWSAAEWSTGIGRPVRVQGVDFLTPSGGQTGRRIQLEVRMAHGPTQFPTGNFQSNMVADETLVFPAPGAPNAFTTPTTAAGQFALQIPFATEFQWDGESGVVLDIRIFDNGNFNQPYPYDVTLETPVVGSPFVSLYDDRGNPNATSANRFLTRGPRVRIRFVDGATLSFGQGCAGDGGFVPIASTMNGPAFPDNQLWTHVLSSAPSQRTAAWFFGDSREEIVPGIPLPLQLGFLNAPNCELLVKPDLNWTTQTVGGGAGAGTASLRTPVPPVTNIVGLSFFTQWLILDPFSANNTLAATNGEWHIFGP